MPIIRVAKEGASANAGALPCSKDAMLDAPDSALLIRLVLRPNRSLSRKGFAWVLLITWAFLLVPLVPMLGTIALWVMLPFLLAVPIALWLSIERNYRDGKLCEEVLIWPELIRVHRRTPRSSAAQNWEASPFWTRLTLLREGGPVDNYVTLKGNGREIELGSFLSADERIGLHRAVAQALAKAGSADISRPPG